MTYADNGIGISDIYVHTCICYFYIVPASYRQDRTWVEHEHADTTLDDQRELHGWGVIGEGGDTDDNSTGRTPRLSYKWDTTFPVCTVAPKCRGGRSELSIMGTGAPAQSLSLSIRTPTP